MLKHLSYAKTATKTGKLVFHSLLLNKKRLFLFFLYNVFAILPLHTYLNLFAKRCHFFELENKSFWGLTSCATSVKLTLLNKRSRHQYLLISPFKKHCRIHTSKFYTTNHYFTSLVKRLVLQFNIFYINYQPRPQDAFQKPSKARGKGKRSGDEVD